MHVTSRYYDSIKRKICIGSIFKLFTNDVRSYSVLLLKA